MYIGPTIMIRVFTCAMGMGRASTGRTYGRALGPTYQDHVCRIIGTLLLNVLRVGAERVYNM